MRTHIWISVVTVAMGCADEPAIETEPAEVVGPIALPIEVMPTDPADFAADTFTVARSFELTAGELASLTGGVLYLQGHGLGYRDGRPPKDGKGSVRLDGGPWIDLVNTGTGITISEPEVFYQGIGGGFRTVRMTIALAQLCAAPATCATASPHTIELRWNGTDGTGSGYRIVDLDLRTAAGAGIFTVPGDLSITDPATWTPPLPSPANRAEGERLFRERAILVDNPIDGRPIIASCADCHAQDGRDLEYYAFSNLSIVNRAVFHGLTITQGAQIASYIRQLGVPRNGRPWNPPYQPGPDRDALGVAHWAAGAGVAGVLDEENATMLAEVLPFGTTVAGITDAIYGTGLPASTINLREIPIAIQLPDWNSWLPEVHPIDLWDACGWEGAGDGTFAAHVTYGTGIDPDGVATADFDGDGHLDVAVGNTYSSSMGVLLGNGDGTFAPQTTTAVGSNPLAVAVADFDEDGDPDAAVANFASDTVSLLTGNGDGTFAAAINTAVGPRPRAIATGDFNGDGHADVVVPNYLGQSVSVLRGTGLGTFLAQRVTAAGDHPFALAAGDFDRDGKLDLAVANQFDDTVGVLRGRGNGWFDPQVAYAVVIGPTAVRAVDLDHDGLLDLAVGGSAGVSVLLGQAGGTFGAATAVTASAYGLAADDLDGDGHMDLIGAAVGLDRVEVLLGNGDGAFAPRATFATGDYPTTVAAGDFDGDGARDLVATNGGPAANTVSVLLANSCMPAEVVERPSAVYQDERADLAALDLTDPADIALLPDVVGPLEDAVREFIDAGWVSGTAGQDDWRTIRGTVIDRAVLRGYSFELVKRSLAQWMAVKDWEVMQEFALEEHGPTVFGAADGELYSWPMGAHQAVHPIAPHITSIAQNKFKDPATYDAEDNACLDPANLGDPDCVAPLHAGQTLIKADYDSTAWYHLQMILHAGARSMDVPFDSAVRPVDWPYALEHVDDVPRDMIGDPTNPGAADPPWESLRYLATMIKAYQMRNNGKGPALTGWAMREVTPRLLVGSWRGHAENVELLTGLDAHQAGLRANVTNAFLDVFLEITDETVHAEFVGWPRLPVGGTNERESWWKLDDTDYLVTGVADSNAVEFPVTYFHHADHMFRTAPRLAAAGATADRIDAFIDWAKPLWPGLGNANDAAWEALRPPP